MNGTGMFTAYLPGLKPDHVQSKAMICDGKPHTVTMIYEPRRVRLLVDGKIVGEERVERLGRVGVPAKLAIGRLVEGGLGCRGEVEGSFDGAPYGVVALDYGDGAATLTVRTLPPETGITTLRLRDGFADTERARSLLERHAEQVGLEIDWSRPQSFTVDGRTTVEFGSAEGLNAFARMTGPGQRVDTVEVSLAL